jgi:hypothetical protein
LLPTRPAKDFHLQSSAHVRHTFALVAKATFMPPIDIASLPASLLDRFAAGIAKQHLVAPIPWAHDGRRVAMCAF